MRDEGRADIAGALDQVDDAGRQARVDRTRCVELTDPRAMLGRLDDHGVAGDERGNDVGVEQVGRVVVGPDDDEDTLRVGPRLAVPPLGDEGIDALEAVLGHEVDAGAQRFGLADRLAVRLARLVDDGRRHLFDPRVERVAQLLERSDALADRP